MATLVLPLSFSIDAPAFAREVNRAVADIVTRAMRSGYEQAVLARVRTESARRVRDTREYLLLTADPAVRGELGIKNPAAAIEGVIAALANGVSLAVQWPAASPAGITGGASLGVLRKDFADVLSSPLAHFVSEHGHGVDWLRWLLLEGQGPVAAVAGYSFLGPSRKGKGRGRTGLGIMRKGGSWSVPAPVAGTAAANWLTRAMTGAEQVLGDIMVDELARRLT